MKQLKPQKSALNKMLKSVPFEPIGVATKTLAVLAVTCCGLATGCNEKKAKDFIGEILAPMLPAIAQTVINDPAVRNALGEGGDELARVAWIVVKPMLENKIAELDLGDEDERLAYKRIKRANPDLAAIFYRTEDGIPAGLWPRLDTWLKAKGYIGGASAVWRHLGYENPKLIISKEHLRELEDLMGTAIVEEYLVVREGNRHYKLPDFEDNDYE